MSIILDRRHEVKGYLLENSWDACIHPVTIWAGFAFDLNYNLPYFSGAAIMVAGFEISLIWLSGQEDAARAGVRPRA